jgi:endonuclease/exonuclease/phosphatase family metal-dependent hydrolase
VDDCREEFANLDVECQSCFDLRSHDFDIERRFEECAAKQLSGNCTFLFDGWSDNLLLSKTPFLQTDFLLYTDSPLAQWTVLYAQVNTSTFSTPANIFCTHLSARLPIVDTSLANERQIRQLAQYIASKTNSSSPVFVMGDFNTGPRTDGLDATRPENFNTFINAGYNSVLLGLNQTICTYCGSENPLAKSTTSQDWMIDHIFVPSQSDICTVSGIRIADNNTYVTLNNGDTSPLSDHYGVKASFCEGNFNLSPHTFDAIQALNPSYAERIALPSLLFLLFWALLNVSF